MNTEEQLERIISSVEVPAGDFAAAVRRGRRLRAARRRTLAGSMAAVATVAAIIGINHDPRPAATATAEDTANTTPSTPPGESTPVTVRTVPGWQPPLTQPGIDPQVAAAFDSTNTSVLYASTGSAGCGHDGEASQTGDVVTLTLRPVVADRCGLSLKLVSFIIGEGDVIGVRTLKVTSINTDGTTEQQTYDLFEAAATATPLVAHPGQRINVTHEDDEVRGIGYTLLGENRTVYYLTDAETPTWTTEPTMWPDIGTSGPAHLVVPPTAEPGTYGLCSANSAIRSCTTITVKPGDD